MVVKVNVEKMEKSVGVESDPGSEQKWSLNEEFKLVKKFSKGMKDAGLFEGIAMFVLMMVVLFAAFAVIVFTWPLWAAYALYKVTKKES